MLGISGDPMITEARLTPATSARAARVAFIVCLLLLGFENNISD
jgi:hypothetical protein